MINRERIVEEFLELVAIPAPSRGERQVADVLKKRMVDIGLEVTEDNVGQAIGGNCGNVFGYLKGNSPGAPVIMLSAHLDMVEPCINIKPIRKDGVITSSGDTILGSDCKSGIVPILEAIRVIQEQKLPRPDIQVVFTVAEEGGLNGAKKMDPKALKADFGYAMDGGGEPGKVIIKAPGQNSFDIVIHGKTAHAGLAPEEGNNAIILAAKALTQVKQGRIDFETTTNMGIINGGVATNIVPDRVEIKAEARSRNEQKLEKITSELIETFKHEVESSGGQIEICVRKAYDSFVLSPEDALVTLAMEAARQTGLTAALEETGGGSDANYFNKYGVPCAILSTGMSKVHTKEEYILEDHLYQTCEWTIAILAAAAKK